MLRRVVVLGFTAALALVAEPLLAIPAFARRYGVACHFCHQGFPKLNATGERFKGRGFRMEKEETFSLDRWARSVPVVLRASPRHDFIEGVDDSNTAFLKGVSAGNLGRWISYWVDDGVLVSDGEGDTFTHTKPDNAWGRVEIVRDGKLYLKGGRFEMDLPFTQARTSHLYSYDIYFANTGSEYDNIGDFQHGAEVGGSLPRDVHWSAAVVSGHNRSGASEVDDAVGKFEGNVFLRLAKRINEHRVGALAYIGRNTLVAVPGVSAKDTLVRLGVDASVWVRGVNLYGLALYGRNDNPIVTAAAPRGTEQALAFRGGFVQGDWHLRDDLVLTLRGNLVSRDTGNPSADRVTDSSVFPGVQFFLGQHAKLSFEYGFFNRQRPDLGAVQVDVAF